jgi:hypothetical protein
MLNLKSRKIIFLLLIALLTGGSLMVSAQSELSFWSKAVYWLWLQPMTAIALYLLCFFWDEWPGLSAKGQSKRVNSKPPFSA